MKELSTIIKELEIGVADKKNDKMLIAKNYMTSFDSIVFLDNAMKYKAEKHISFNRIFLMHFLKIRTIGSLLLSEFFRQHLISLKPYMRKTSKNEMLSYTYRLSEIDDTRMRLYKESGMVDQIYEIYTEILKKKQSIDKQLKETYKNEVSLLDLV